MGYTIGKAAEISGLTTHTLRYYDKAGLLPFVGRTDSGQRSFNDNDIEWLSIITCLKNTGMQIKDIKKYIDWCKQGADTMEKRREMFAKQKLIVEEKMKEYQKWLNKIDYKIWYYDKAIETDFEELYGQTSCDKLRKLYEQEKQNNI